MEFIPVFPIPEFSVISVTWSFRIHSNLLIYCTRNFHYYWKQLCCCLIF